MSTRRVLLIDDHRDTAEAMGLMLGLSGYSVLATDNCDEALRLASEQRPCLIVLDLTLPRDGGVVFRQRQLADPELADIPCVCVSGRHDAPDVARQLGIDTCFIKPVDFADLGRAIDALCGAAPA
jgi:twitching motility two-component system response regulator PilH